MSIRTLTGSALYTDTVLPVYQCTKITSKPQGLTIYFILPANRVDNIFISSGIMRHICLSRVSV